MTNKTKGNPGQISESLVPNYIRDLKVYQAGKPIDELAREKGLTHISKLASNENPLGPSPYAIREMTNALWDIHRYPDMNSYDVKKALCELYDIKMENIALGNGSEGLMGNLASAFLSPGKEVLTCENTFIAMYILTRKMGANLNCLPLTEDYRFDVEALAKAINDNTKIIYIANPNNPTGTYITKDEFNYLMDHVPDHVLVILDEAYFEFAHLYDDYPNSMDYRYDNVITLRTFSKAYGLAGIRIGYGFGHEDLINNFSKVKMTFEPNLIAQRAALGALKDRPHLERTLSENSKYLKECHDFLTEHELNPIKSVTNFIAFKTGSGEASDYLFEQLLNEGVIIRPLKANEMPDFVRVSIGTKEEMQHFYTAMNKVMPDFKSKYLK